MSRSYILILGSLLLILSGCLKEEESLFSESAAERLNNAISRVDSLLKAAPNGWEMQYFANSESAGYNLLVSFKENTETKFAANNRLFENKYTEAVSTYDIIGDNGPVLSFDTYNDVMHFFSDPVDPAGVGLGGDFEFVVISSSDSLVILKGKKHNTNVIMKALPQNVDWDSYLDSINSLESEILACGSLFLIDGNDTVAAMLSKFHVFEFDFDDEVSEMPFVITNYGMRFYDTIQTKSGLEVYDFYINATKDKLISKGNPNVYFEGPLLAEYFIESHSTFNVDFKQMSSQFIAPTEVLSTKLNERYNGKRNLDVWGFSYDDLFGNSFMFKTAPTEIKSDFSLIMRSLGEGGRELTIIKEDGVYDSNAEIFIKTIPEVKDLWEVVAGTYELTSTISRKSIKFIAKNDNTKYFVVNKE